MIQKIKAKNSHFETDFLITRWLEKICYVEIVLALINPRSVLLCKYQFYFGLWFSRSEPYTQYKKHMDRGVTSAAKGLIQLYRQEAPMLLAKKDRGKPNESQRQIVPACFGSITAKDFIPGAEILSTADQESMEVEEAGTTKDEQEPKVKFHRLMFWKRDKILSRLISFSKPNCLRQKKLSVN